MFTWICPQCGAEVPPAYSDCPNCKPPAPPPPRAVAPPPPPAPVAPSGPTFVSRPTPTAPPRPTAPPPPAYEQAPAPQPVAPAAPAAQPQYVYAPPPPRQALPGWLVTLLVFGVLAGGLYAVYNYVLNKPAVAATEPAATPPGSAESAGSAAVPGARRRGNLEKNLEVAGIRIQELNKRPQLRMMLINHASADMAELAGTVTLTADGKALASVPFSISTLGAYEAKEITAPLKTGLRAYELPDWQFIKAQVSLKSVE